MQGFGYQQGSRIIGLSGSGITVIQRLAEAVVAEQVSDDAVIGVQSSGNSFTDSYSYSFFAGGGGPFGNSRTYQTSYGTMVNTIVESSTEGWVPLTLREDDVGDFRLHVQQVTEELVIENITAGASDNTITGATQDSRDTVALIDAGAGNDVVDAGQYDFVFGNDGDDDISGGAFAYGGNGFDNLSGAGFLAGGADDDFLSGGEGETIFHFRFDEAGWDQIEDRNGISLNDFAVKAGLVDSYSNLIYGGKVRYLNGDFLFEEAFRNWRDRNPSWTGFSYVELDHGLPFHEAPQGYYVLGNSGGFPRGVPDELARELAPGWGDGYYTWVFNSLEDMMRDFADLGLAFDPAAIQFIPEVADLAEFAADNYEALRPYFDQGILEKDVVELSGFRPEIDTLEVGFVPPDEVGDGRALRLVWGEDKIIDIELPSANDLIGHGIEEISFGGDSFYIGEMVEWAEESGVIGTPYEDYIMGTQASDVIRGLGGWDFIDGGAGDDSLSGGSGPDSFFFAEGAGSDTILDGDAEDVIEFDAGITSAQLRLGLGSLRLGYGSAGDQILFEGFDPDDVYASALFSVLQFWDVEEVELPDGSPDFIWTLSEELTYGQVLERGFDLTGTAEGDILRGTNIHDRFEAGAGNDVLTGGAGSDTYFFSAGDGVDTVHDFAESGMVNRVILRDYLQTDIAGSREGDYVVLRADGSSDELRIRWDDEAGLGVDAVEFADGSVWNRAYLSDLEITGNRPPVVAIPIGAISADEDSGFGFVVPAYTFDDPDVGDILDFSATLADGEALPAWLSFDPETRTFSGTPSNNDVGAIQIRLSATDSAAASVSDTFNLSVLNTNDAPELATALADQNAVQGQSFSFVLPAGSFTDQDIGELLTYTATLASGAPLPDWLVFDDATNTFSGVPGNADVGMLNVRVTATDGEGAAVSDTFAIAVDNVNDAPVLGNPLADQAVTAGTLFSYVVPADTFADADAGDSLSLTARLANGNVLPGWLSFDAATGTFSGTFSGTPSASNVGVLDVEVVATDLSGATGSDSFTVTVNAAPGQILTGTAGVDVLEGGFGNDLIDGLTGADLMVGGDGDDTYAVDHVADNILELPGEGRDSVLSSVTYTLPDAVEDLTITETANRNATGNALTNVITGNSGANRLDGGAGADVLVGGLGNDTYVVDDALDSVFEAAAAGTDTVLSSVSHVLSANVEHLTLTGEAVIDGTGNELANTITGNDAANNLFGGIGNDRLVGGGGIDTLTGGLGNDVYVIDLISDLLIESAGEGTDTVQSPLDYTLAEHLENLTLTGTAINGTGNAVANRLTGNALDNVLVGLEGNDVLNGAVGADTMVGGSGNDSYVVDNSGDITVELAGEGTDTVQTSVNYALSAEIENLTLTGVANLEGTGNALANRLTGNAGANVLYGMAGNDILDGRAGADALLGGEGNDTYYVDQADDLITEFEGEGTDVVISSVTYALADHVENMTLSGTAAIHATGNNGANLLIGNVADNQLSGLDGNDVLDGKAGADTLAGGAGNDSYVVENLGDLVVEVEGEGIDTVQSTVAWTLGDNLENLTLTGSAAINGAGNALDNLLSGNNANNTLSGFDGNDVLDGKGGNDSLFGGAGDDVYVVAQAGDVVIEMVNEGVDTVRSAITYTLGEHVENLVLTGASAIRGTGNALVNMLAGNSGNNQLDGLLGADVMSGGAGNDTYLVDDVGDQVVELAGEGVDVVKSTVTYELSAEVENLTLTGNAAIDGTGNVLDNILLGNAAANTLIGGAGNDTLSGGIGADAMIGGSDNDIYTVDNVGDTTIELDGEGIDTVNTALTWTLGEHVENLNLAGASNRNGTGNAMNNIIAGNRGINILNGMAGNDTLSGGLGNDTYRFDLNFGHDLIAEDDATAGNLDRIQFGAGISASDIALGRLNDDLVVRTVDQQNSIQIADWFLADAHKIERIEFAGGVFWDAATIQSEAMQTVDMPGLLRGDSQASVLLGQIGNTILEGGDGNDTLTDEDGNNLFSGGTGDDVAVGGDGNDLFVGGNGNDTLYTGSGSNVIAFNAGSGVDAVYSEEGAENTLSLGGGLRYSDLSLSRDSNDLILNAGADDRIVLKDWYAGKDNLLNIQVILDATDEFDAASADPIYNHRIQNFDFLGMVGAFNAAQASNPGLSQWALGDALTQYHLSGADDAALGGDLAYWYARNDALTGIGVSMAQQIIGNPGFGADAQGLREFSGLQEGLVRLG